MRSFEEYNPFAILAHTLAVTLPAMLCLNPVIAGIALAGGAAIWFVRNGTAGAGVNLNYIALLCVMTILNPLFNHRGATVLFVLNNNPVTLESLLYGACTGLALLAVLFWFRTFTQIMTSDRLLYLFGSLSPRMALMLSMVLRFIPLFAAQSKKTAAVQKALGLYCDDTLLSRIKGRLRVFSIMVTWALENGITTAESMEARGYSCGKRSRFTLFRFTARDGVLCAISLLLFSLCAYAIAVGMLDFAFFPNLVPTGHSAFSTLIFFAYVALSFAPVTIEVKEMLRWRYLLSKI